MKKNFAIKALILTLFTIVSVYPAVSFATNGHQLSAIGAYSEGMGGAVTAAPYDASTAITNPAGMAMIGNRTDFSFMTFFPKRSVQFPGNSEEFGGSPFYLVPAIGWTAPVNDRNDLFFGGGMYGVSGMGVDYGTIPANFPAPGSQASIWSQYQFWKMAPTLAGKSGNLAWGIALNLDYQAFGFKQVFTGGFGTFGFDLSQMQGALGYGATVGAIYQVSPEFSVGASYASKQRFGDFKWRLGAGDVDTTLMGGPTSLGGMYKMRLDFPQQAAVGIALRPVKKLLWTADVKWIEFSDTYDVVTLRGSFSGGVPAVQLNFGWDDVWVLATGLQYEITPNFVARVGYNHSNSPIKEEDVENNVAFPAIVEDRISGGFTYRLGRHWELTAAYMQALKSELIGSMSTTKITLEEKAVDMEISYRF